ncbi:hypothetical protein F4802DRAFT_432169 [Xylaria palmicola]|nr:hypothetical protein F4802DRAFT_432169 [Xylaria palmicola]
MDFRAATTRLRRTFAYPSDTTTASPTSSRHLSDSDDDSDDGRPALDEQEQEELILALARQNAARDAQFRLALLALPALSAVPYLVSLLSALGLATSGDGDNSGGGRGRGRRSAANAWLALVALSSLAATAWTLWSLPPGVTGIRALDVWAAGGSNPSSSSSSSGAGAGAGDAPLLGPMGANALRRRRRASAGSHPLAFWARGDRSPLELYLPFLNVALCALLVFAGFLSSSSGQQRAWGHVGLANLPAAVYAVVLVAKMLMGSIDPERELGALRYGYKGA